jgi:hypothetical protein
MKYEPIKGTTRPTYSGPELGGGPSEIARFLKEVLPVLMASPAPPTKTQRARKLESPKRLSQPSNLSRTVSTQLNFRREVMIEAAMIFEIRRRQLGWCLRLQRPRELGRNGSGVISGRDVGVSTPHAPLPIAPSTGPA